MAAKKRAKRSSKKKSEPAKDNSLLVIGIVAALIVIFAVAAYMLSQDAPAATPDDGVLVLVNGQPITQASLDFQYNLLPDTYKQQLSKEDVLEQVINEELVTQEARAMGIEATQEDVHARIQEILSQGGLAPEDLQENLDFFGVTMEEFESLVRRQLLIQGYTDTYIEFSDPTEEELTLLYDATKERYAVPEQVRVRHILVSSQRTDAAQLAKDLYDQARDGADFCALVDENTDDRGSRETCGEYTFPRDFMVPEFEEASFDAAPGEFRLVQTTFGYHVIEKLEDIPARDTPLDEVRESLVAEHKNLQYSQRYNALLGTLRAQAEIVYADGETSLAVPEETPEEAAAPEEQVVPEAAQADPMSCIAGRATLYGASWNTDAQAARDEFAGYDLTYVDCDTEACDVAGYPAWEIDDSVYLGKKSVAELAELAGC